MAPKSKGVIERVEEILGLATEAATKRRDLRDQPASKKKSGSKRISKRKAAKKAAKRTAAKKAKKSKAKRSSG